MKYIKIKTDLFLTGQSVPSVPSTKTVKVSDSTAHIWIYDRSYSMSHDLSQLSRDIVTRARGVPEGDTVSLGWFSSEGQYNFILKGFKINNNSDWEILEKAVSANNSPVGCTCFSEILYETSTVVKDLSIFSDTFSLMFFSDGQPVVRNYHIEIDNIFNAINKLSDKVTASLMVGYGNYYNKELLSEMAKFLGGSLVHCDQLSDFDVSLNSFIEQSQNFTPKIEVKLETDSKKEDLAFTIRDGSISTHVIMSNNTVNVSPKKRGNLDVFVLTSKPPINATEILISEEMITRSSNKETLIQGMYAAAFLLTQKTKNDLALDVLSALGDKKFIDTVSNAFTNADYGKAEAEIKGAVFKPKYNRLAKGFDTNYLPKEDAFCLLDAMDILISDAEANFYPFHPDFTYRRIGQKSKVKDGYPIFVADKDAKCPISSLTWNSSKLNLSVLANISGTVMLPEGYKKVGFSEKYPTFVWRNYTIIKDGFLNVNNLPVTLSEYSYKILSNEGVIWNNGPWEENRIYILELTKVPVINRATSVGKTSATNLCHKIYEELKLKGTMKALNAIKKELSDGQDGTMGTVFTDNQQVFLTNAGFRKDGSFSPPVDKAEAVDSYMAKEFSIKVKGYSSLPSLKDVKKKIDANKPQTATGELVEAGWELFNQKTDQSMSKSLQIATVNELITTTKSDLFSVRKYIQAAKFSVILASKWFDEFKSREENSLTVDGIQYEFNLKEILVNI